MSFYTLTPYPLFVHDYNLVSEEVFFNIPFRFAIWKSGMMGCTYISIKMALVYKAYDEEFAANGFDPYRDAFKCFDINNDLGALRLDSLRHAYHLSLKNN